MTKLSDIREAVGMMTPGPWEWDEGDDPPPIGLTHDDMRAIALLRNNAEALLGVAEAAAWADADYGPDEDWLALHPDSSWAKLRAALAALEDVAPGVNLHRERRLLATVDTLRSALLEADELLLPLAEKADEMYAAVWDAHYGKGIVTAYARKATEGVQQMLKHKALASARTRREEAGR